MNVGVEPKTIFFIGARGSGKTTWLSKASLWLDERHISYAGILSKGFFCDGIRTHYDLQCLPKALEVRLCQRDFQKGWIQGGGFWFNPEAVKMGLEHINTHGHNADLVILDEIGRLELEGKIWNPLMDILPTLRGHKLLAVRHEFITPVCERWGIKDFQIFDTAIHTGHDLNELMSSLHRI